MRFRNQIVWTLFFQGGGAVAGLATLALLGLYSGPAAQGVFSLIKIEVAFVGAIAILGLTQSLFYYVQSNRMSIRHAQRLAFAVAIFGGGIALGYSVLVQRWAGLMTVIFTFASAVYVWFGCLRGIILARSTARMFNLITALPQGLLLLYAIIAVTIQRVTNSDVALAMLVTYSLTVWIAIRLLSDASLMTPVLTKEERLLPVMQYGFAAGIAEVSATAALLFAAKSVLVHFAETELGLFTFALALAQGLLVPVSYTLPLFFKRWMQQPDAKEVIKIGALIFLVFGCFALLSRIFLGHFRVVSWFDTYSPMVSWLWIILLGAAFDGCQKIVVAYTNAQGAPWLSAKSEAIRMITVIAGFTLLPIQHLRDAAWVICLASVATFFILLLTLSRFVNWTARDVK